MYTLGFFRALNPQLQAELRRRGIDPSPLLWNEASASHLNYSYDAEAQSAADSDSDLSGFIDDTPRDKWGNPIEAAELADEAEDVGEEGREESGNGGGDDDDTDDGDGVLGKRGRLDDWEDGGRSTRVKTEHDGSTSPSPGSDYQSQT